MSTPRPEPVDTAAGVAGATDGCSCCSAETPVAAGPARISDARRVVLSRRVRLLVAATITYNVIEAVVALVAGTVASSAALIGFGWTR